MKSRRHTRLVREGRYAAEVDVELIEGDISTASRHGRVYSLTPISQS